MSQLDLIDSPFDGRSLIEASAGTGKTWTLAALYVRLLLERRLAVGNLLVVTFTKAATAELRQRIRDRLVALLRVYTEGPGPDESLNRLQARFADDDSRRRLLLAVHGFDEAAIFTIHGFCQRALQDAAFEAGGDFDCQLSGDDGEQIQALLKDLWRREMVTANAIWAGYLGKAKITPLRLAQELRPHLGKAFLQIEPRPQAPPPWPDLAGIWAAAGRLWQAASGPWLGELAAHGGLNQNSHKKANLAIWQAQLDAYFAHQSGLLDAPVGLKKLRAEALRKGTNKGHVAPVNRLAEALEQLAQMLELTLQQCDQRLVQLRIHLLHALNSEMPKRKAAQRLLAFDDLLNQLYQALSGPGGEQLTLCLRQRYPVALVDEFQDTDPTQYGIFSLIYPPAMGVDLCLVGDPKQAIYAFRGADLATYLRAREEAARHYSLAINHRSSASLLAALNQVFQRPLPFAEERLDYVPVSAAERPRPHLSLAMPSAPLSLVWLGDEPMGKGLAGQQAARDTAARIAELLAGAAGGRALFQIEGSASRPLQGGDIAVLVYSNRQASLMAEALDASGVASVRRGRDSVWHSEEAENLAAVLAAYAQPSRQGLLRYALASRLLGRSPRHLDPDQPDSGAWDEECVRAEGYHRLWLERGFLPLLHTWLEQEGVAQRLLRLADGERRLTNLLHLGELLQRESLVRPGPGRLLAWFAEQRRDQAPDEDALMRLESDAERVQIVTIHSAKGLEYPLVFCPFLWDGSLLKKDQPASCHDEQGRPLLDFGGADYQEHQRQARREAFAERLRLAYVALTRARDYLWVHAGPIDCAVHTGNGAVQDQGLHTSALAWLLHGRQLSGPDPLAALAAHLAEQSPEGLRGELESLAASSRGAIALLPTKQAAADPLAAPRGLPPVALSHLGRRLNSVWRISSFSALAGGRHAEGADRDNLPTLDPSQPGSGFFGFPRGVRAGTCLHAIFEDWARGKAPMATLVCAALRTHGIDPALWQETVAEQLSKVVHSDLDGQGLTLAGLSPRQRLPEISFTFPVRDLDMARLRQLLQDPAMGLEESARTAAGRLTFERLAGYLKGFIDLVFQHQGLWYIADYKSNWLGPEAAYYDQERLAQAIADEHYYLQYLIYLVALRRFLRQRLAAFDSSMLGGAWYLFLRGMPQAGVYFSRPRDELLDGLDALFGGRS